MKNGICPKCGGHEIFVTRDNQFIENSPINDRNLLAMKIYACAGCGFLEHYIQNQKDLERLPRLSLIEKVAG